MSVVVRPAVPEDAEALAALDRRVVEDGRGVVRTPDQSTPAARFRDLIVRHAEPIGLFVVAEVDGVVAGDGSIRRHDVAFCTHVAVLAVQVDPPFQGRGVGRALTEALVRWSDEREVELLQLQVRADNFRAIRLYRSLGFAEEVRRRGYLRLTGATRVDDLGMVRVHRAPEAEHAAAAVLRRVEGRVEIRVCAHPVAGWRLPTTTVEPGEPPARAALRGVEAEAGGLGARLVGDLGSWTTLVPSGAAHRWHGFLVEAADGPPDRPDSAVGPRWVPLASAVEVLPPRFHEVVRRAEAEILSRAG